jgi:hypothetical protein
MKMEIDINSVLVQFYLDTRAEVNIVSKETFDYFDAHSLQKCDEVARLYNGQTATFLGKGRAVFKRRDHATEDVFYVVPRGSLNLLSYPTVQCQGRYIADAEAASKISTKHPSTSKAKSDVVASLKNSFPDVFMDGLGQCTVTTATLTLKQNATPVYRRSRSVPYASTDCGARA